MEHETNETIDKPISNGVNPIRDEQGKFLPGNPGGGRPKGSVSVMTRLKQMFENDPEDFERFVKTYKENPDNQKHIVEMIDGKPKQSMDLAVKELPIIEISETIINKHDNK